MTLQRMSSFILVALLLTIVQVSMGQFGGNNSPRVSGLQITRSVPSMIYEEGKGPNWGSRRERPIPHDNKRDPMLEGNSIRRLDINVNRNNDKDASDDGDLGTFYAKCLQLQAQGFKIACHNFRA